MKTNLKQKNGFTLIELILYIALVSIFITGAILFIWDLIYSEVKSGIQQEVNQNLRFVSKRVLYEVRNSSGINSVSANTISLSNSDSAKNPTVIDVSSNQIRIGQGNSGSCPVSAPCALTSSDLIFNISFEDLSSGSESLNIQFTVSVQSNSDRDEWDYQEEYSSSAEIRSN